MVGFRVRAMLRVKVIVMVRVRVRAEFRVRAKVRVRDRRDMVRFGVKIHFVNLLRVGFVCLSHGAAQAGHAVYS